MKLKFALSVILCLLALSAGPLSAGEAEAKGWTLALSAGVGFGFGTFNELVFPPAGHAHPYLSELIWNVEPRPTLDIKAEFTLKDRFRFSAAGVFYLPGECGIMEDYDWLYHNLDAWTHYSRSRIFLLSGITADFQLSWRLFKTGKLYLELGLNYDLCYFDFSDKLDYLNYTSGLSGSGTTIYDPGDPFRDYTADQNGSNAIDYRVLTMSTGLLLAAGYQIGSFLLRGEIAWSPFLIYRGKDRHLARNLEFNDTVSPFHTLSGRMIGTFF
jgi:outer membrane protease